MTNQDFQSSHYREQQANGTRMFSICISPLPFILIQPLGHWEIPLPEYIISYTNKKSFTFLWNKGFFWDVGLSICVSIWGEAHK